MTTRLGRKLGDRIPGSPEELLRAANTEFLPLLKTIQRKMNALVSVQETTVPTDIGIIDGAAVAVLVHTADAAWANGDTVSLPAEFTEGDLVIVKDADGSAATKSIVVDVVDSATTIDGAATQTITLAFGYTLLIAGPDEWHSLSCCLEEADTGPELEDWHEFGATTGTFAVRFVPPHTGTGTLQLAEFNAQIVIPYDYVCDQLQAYFKNSNAGVATVTFTARKEQSDTALTCAIAPSGVFAEDATNSFTGSKGDRVSIKWNPDQAGSTGNSLGMHVLIRTRRI